MIYSLIMFRRNSNCDECNFPYKIVWNCKRNIFEKDWLYLCYNCVRLNKYLYRRYFKSHFQNIDCKEAGARAAAKVLESVGFEAYANSRLD